MRKLLLPIIAFVFSVAIFASPRPQSKARSFTDEERQHLLNQWYQGYNHEYFQDELPDDVIISRTLSDDKFMALTFYDSGHYHIEINPKYNLSTKTERINLLHESCHVEMFVEKEDEFDDHGPHWQACMLRLANAGAFQDIW